MSRFLQKVDKFVFGPRTPEEMFSAAYMILYPQANKQPTYKDLDKLKGFIDELSNVHLEPYNQIKVYLYYFLQIVYSYFYCLVNNKDTKKNCDRFYFHYYQVKRMTNKMYASADPFVKRIYDAVMNNEELRTKFNELDAERGGAGLGYVLPEAAGAGNPEPSAPPAIPYGGYRKRRHTIKKRKVNRRRKSRKH